jgi:hypothetical protein
MSRPMTIRLYDGTEHVYADWDIVLEEEHLAVEGILDGKRARTTYLPGSVAWYSRPTEDD